MKWIAAGKDAFKTEDGRYSVARVTCVNAQGPYPQWAAFSGKTMFSKWHSQEQAKAACEGRTNDAT